MTKTTPLPLVSTSVLSGWSLDSILARMSGDPVEIVLFQASIYLQHQHVFFNVDMICFSICALQMLASIVCYGLDSGLGKIIVPTRIMGLLHT